MRPLLSLLLLVVALQDPGPEFRALLDRLKAEEVATRDAAQRELSDWLDDDAKAKLAREAAEREGGEVATRIARALEGLAVNKALRRLEAGDLMGLSDLFEGGEPALEKVEALAKRVEGRPEAARACARALERLRWTWHADHENVRVGFRSRSGDVAFGGAFTVEVRAVNGSGADRKFGNIVEHMHVQFSPMARLRDAAGNSIQARIRLDPAGLPSSCKGGCEVTLPAGRSAVLKGKVEAVSYSTDEALPPGDYRLEIHLDDDTWHPDSRVSIPVSVLGKK